LALTGPATLGGAIGDGGTLTLSDAAISGLVVYGAATLIDSGTITQTGGSIDLGGGASDTVTLAVQSGATYNVSVGAWIGNPNGNVTGTSTITNAGLFESTSASSVDVWHSVVTSTGTLLSDGYLALIGPTATLSRRAGRQRRHRPADHLDPGGRRHGDGCHAGEPGRRQHFRQCHRAGRICR
jgi:hypothetical protein